MLKSFLLLLMIFGLVPMVTFELAEFFLKENEFRKFWLKVWLGIGGIVSLFLWLVLIFWEK